MLNFEILSLNVSNEKGVPKRPVIRVLLVKDHGIEGDAHAGPGLRQVSLLASEDIAVMVDKGAEVSFGDFAENITTRGIELWSLPIGSRIKIGDTILEITQIGKQCHNGCAIMQKVGECIMPKRGVFACVVQGGEITNESSGTYGF
jgi:MOSC domain-containing protein YiiM